MQREIFLISLHLQVVHFTAKQVLQQIDELKLLVADIVKQRVAQLLA